MRLKSICSTASRRAYPRTSSRLSSSGIVTALIGGPAFIALLPDSLETSAVAIVIAHVFFNVAVVTRIVGGAWATIDPAAGEVAATVFKGLGLDPHKEMPGPQGRPVPLAEFSLQPIKELF